VTPEPERELPDSVATLRAGGAADPAATAAERERVERLVVTGRQRRWLAYLREALALADSHAGTDDPRLAEARAVVVDVVHNHHQLLLGLPGRAAERTAAEREHLETHDAKGATR
jgi:shikimate 5-dehydrogenase